MADMRLRIGLKILFAALLAQIGLNYLGRSSEAPPSCRDTKDPNLLISRAQQAIGSVKAKLVSLTARGALKVTPPAFPSNFEMSAIIPDKYFEKIDWTQNGEKTVVVRGFNGTESLNEIKGSTPGTIKGKIQRASDWMVRSRDPLAQILLGWFALPMPGDKPVFEYGGLEKHRDHDSVLLNIRGSSFRLRKLWLDANLCTPTALIFEKAKTVADPSDPGASAPGLVRVEIVLSDRRISNGFWVPHHILWVIAGKPGMDWPIELMQTNGKIDPALFTPPKR